MMSVNVRLPDDLARRVEAVAAERGTTVEVAAVDLLSAALGEPQGGAERDRTKRQLAFAAIGASGS
jgi:predicted transcriptional regulator